LKRAHNPKVVGSNPTPATNEKAQEANHFLGLDVSGVGEAM